MRAAHPWDEPAELLASRAAERGVHLVRPRLGAAIEPSRVERVDPWWRGVRSARSLASLGAGASSPALEGAITQSTR